MKRGMILLLVCTFLLAAAGCGIPEEPDPTLTLATEQPTETEPEVPSTDAPTEPVIIAPEPRDADLVRVCDHIPGVRQALAYATDNNFTGQPIYDFTDAYLRYGTVRKLAAVSAELAQQGLGILIWDGFRPVSAQQRLWDICPDPAYVSHPQTGKRNHCRGNAVDLTLVDLETGETLPMPTGFDDFSALADRDYSECDPEAAANALLLETVMESHGLVGYSAEWWHFTDETAYDVVEDFEPRAVSEWYADCEAYISLRAGADVSAEVIARIPAGERLAQLATLGDFALVEYRDVQGYVLRSDIRSAELSETVPTDWVANCLEFISLRPSPDAEEVLGRIPAAASLELLGWSGKYARVFTESGTGYVLSSYIMPADAGYLQSCLSVVEPTAVYTHDQMLADLEALAQQYSNVELDSIGTSELGRDIPVLRIGDRDAAHHVLLQGAMHGREHMTAWLLTAMAEDWLARGLSADICWHIIPMTNPDGVTISQTQKLTDEQTQIYHRDQLQGNAGTDQAEYAARWKANGLGVDINRNFPAGWGLIDDRTEASSQKYRGESPFSAAEARALRDYTLAYDPDVTISYHAQGSEIYYEYGDRQPVNDRSESLGRAVSEVTGYPIQGSSGLDGAGYKDWVMDELGISSLTIEVGCEDAPLALREIYSVFIRNRDVMSAVAQWLDDTDIS